MAYIVLLAEHMHEYAARTLGMYFRCKNTYLTNTASLNDCPISSRRPANLLVFSGLWLKAGKRSWRRFADSIGRHL